ncbi:MAG: hypothetical protein KGZ97_04530 [Bacteroidetes bacterium]|nr:hypothetical protein [Bacteroidota bacterium]
MKLISIIILVILYSSVSLGSVENNYKTLELKTENKWMCGKIVTETFVDKGGRQHPEIQEYYFVHFNKKYFIKISESEFLGSLADYKNSYARIHATVKSGLWDGNDPNMQSRIGKYLVINHIERVEIPEKLLFIDQNNNSYEISPDLIKYIPIKPAESSSGIYSGGDSKEVKIGTDDFMNLFFLAENALNNGQLHLIKRIKTSSVIKIVYAETESNAIIIDSPEIQAFFTFLKKLLSN